MYNSNNVADKIKTLAKSKGFSVKKVLEGVGLGFNTMSNMKTSMPKADNLARIADYLNCSVDYLLGRTDVVGFTNSTGYDQLDDIDKAEIRGMIKQMLKADKYGKQQGKTVVLTPHMALNQPLETNVAAFGGAMIKTTIAEEENKRISELLEENLKED